MKNSRFFALVTYITDLSKILEIISSHSNSIRAYACILHDKDTTSPHHHIVLRTFNTWSCKNICDWFKSSDQNTFCERVYDRTGIIKYLTHENNEEKAKYNESDIIDGGLSDLIPKDEGCDDCFDILNRMINGDNLMDLVREYGKDFVYHFSSYWKLYSIVSNSQNIHNFSIDKLEDPW